MAAKLQENFPELVRERDRLTATLSSMTEGVLAVDRKGKAFLINRAACKMFGLNRKKTMGRYIREVFDNEKLNTLIKETLISGNVHKFESTDLIPGKRIFRLHVIPIRESNTELGVAIIAHDITELKKLEKMRVDFVANVSHELKTPLASIKGFVETLKDGALEEPENARKFLSIIERHTNRLNNLVGDLLSLSKIESGQIPLELKKTKLRPFINKIIGTFDDHILEKKHTVTVDIPEGLTSIYADVTLLDQALANLLDNAIKYTPSRGEITISANEKNGQVELSVSDTGIGIPEAKLARIFERFYRVDKARSREVGGTGLGLAIVKHIALAHGGTVFAGSKPGHGSTFTITFPKSGS
ncbi:MAG: ATP-binding protein [Candidatus Brocadiales bacterium]|nr:PAS domain S-box protein [Candidatus Bathyanammoxibius sp.]MCQ4574064.1 ATP-binding protein [Candidatus Bathyanammoxibius amoris]